MASIASAAARSPSRQMGIGREPPEQRVERVAPAGHRQREVVVHEQARGRRPVPGCLVVPDGLGHVAVLLVPRGRGAVQRRDRRRRRAPQLQAQQIGEQVVVAEPGPGGVERGDERVLVLELLEDRLGSGAAGEGVGERAADALEDRRCAGAGRAPPAAGARAPRRGGSPPRCARCRRTRTRSALGPGARSARSPPGADRPAIPRCVRAAPRRRRPTARSRSPGAGARVSSSEKRRSGPRSSVSSPASLQAVQAERRLLARREHDAQLRRQPREQQLQPGQRVVGVELVQVVDHQHERLLEPLELGQQPLDHRRAREARRRADPLDDLVAGRIGERVDQVRARTAARHVRRARP